MGRKRRNDDGAMPITDEAVPKKDSRTRFMEQAAHRLNQFCRRADAVGRLANRQLYTYSDAERQRLLRMVDDATAAIHDAFAGKVKVKRTFVLDGQAADGMFVSPREEQIDEDETGS